MEFFKKKIEDLLFTDIEYLVNYDIPESYDLDYKEDYPNSKTLAKLMIGFSNSTGGSIVLGVRCKEGTNIPEEICGVDRGEHSTRITSIAYANSQPKIWPKVYAIKHDNQPEKDIVVIRINEANEPIMYTQGNKFPLRINDKIEYADQPLLRKLFSKKNLSERIEKYLEDRRELQKEKFLDLIKNEPGNRYISINFLSVPFHKGDDLINLNDQGTEDFVKALHFKLGYKLYDRLVDFDNYIINFNYMGRFFKSTFTKDIKDRKILSDFRIYSNGTISCDLIYQAREGKQLQGVMNGFYNESEVDKTTAHHSAYLYHENVPALAILFLYLAKVIYKDRFLGKLFTSMRFLTRDYKIIVGTGDNYYKYSNTNDFNIDNSIEVRSLDNKDDFTSLINEILKDFLRYFGSEIKRLDQNIGIFKQTVDTYLKDIFK